MKRVGVYTEDMSRLRRIELILRGRAEVFLGGEGAPYDLSLADGADTPLQQKRCLVLPGGPISHEWLISLVEKSGGTDARRITLREQGREVIRDGTVTSLTEVEYRLFAELFSADGYLTREELSRRVWGGVRDLGVVNVYIHYLREKLEGDGERVIISSRRLGYRIDEKFERTTVC